MYFKVNIYVCVAVIAFFGIAILWILPCFFKSWSIHMTDGVLTVTFGILIITTHIFPYARMIYTKSCVSPLARAFGLSGVIIKAVSGKLYIPELENKQFDELTNAFSGRNFGEK